jgi:CheY-like chemotaxis protein
MTKILVVDDDEPIRDTLRALLEDNDHIVREVTTGEAALEALEALRETSERYVVLLDLIMPGMDGVAVLRAVLSDRRLSAQHAYLVVTAGGARDVTRAEPLLAELNGRIVTKPFDVDTLLQAINAAALQLSDSA